MVSVSHKEAAPTSVALERESRMTPSYSFYLELLGGLLQPQFVLEDPSLFRSSQLDFDYSSRRCQREGIVYLSVSLYELRKSIDKSLEDGRFECPSSFGKFKKSALPAFLHSIFTLVYTEDGLLRPNASVVAIRHLRQVTSAFYKLEFPFSPQLEKAALDNFVNNEVRVRQFLNNENLWRDASELEVITSAAFLIKRLFDGTDDDRKVEKLGFDWRSIRPKHGPGKVATGEEGLDKWGSPRAKYTRLHSKFAYYRYMYHNTSLLGDLANDYRAMRGSGTTVLEPVSKIALVPKDSRGPRIIAEEPLEVQYIQQGMRVLMTEWIETHAPTAGYVNFTDQTVNQKLALQSSLTGDWATLDMKDASDLVSVDLVKMIFRLKPGLLSALLACRTQFTRFPDSQEMRLKKFAGMGAATCFPVEALVFWSISVAAIAKDLNVDPSLCTSLVYVYGDDIIIPFYAYDVVTEELEAAGLRVNRDKSFVRGHFRESCGVDAYFGENVTATRFSKLFPASSKDGVAYAAWCAYANDLEAKSYGHAASIIYKWVEQIFGPVPYGTKTSPFPCRLVATPERAEELNSQFLKRRERKRYQRTEFYVKYISSEKHDARDFSGWARLNRFLIAGVGDDPSQYTLPKETKVLEGWMAV